MHPTASNPVRTSAGRFTSLLEILTPAERLVATHVLQGSSNKEIATALGKAEATVKHQISSVLRTYGQPSRSRLIAFFHEND